MTAPPRTAPSPAVRTVRSLHATARLTAAAENGVTGFPLLEGDGPLDLRRLRPRGSQARLCLLNAMSAPHNGDRLRVEGVIGPGSDVHVTSATATVALPGPAPGHAAYDVALRVEDSARLHWTPRPTVSAVGSDLRQSVQVDLAPTARLLLGEQQLLGRAHEPSGRLTSRLTVRRAGRTVLDQQTSYGPGAPGWDGPAVLAAHRAVGQILVIDPALEALLSGTVLLDDPASGGHGMATPLPGHGGLLTAVAPDAGGLRRLLTAGLRRLGLDDHDDSLVPD